jgi:hypothetical protein
MLFVLIERARMHSQRIGKAYPECGRQSLEMTQTLATPAIATILNLMTCFYFQKNSGDFTARESSTANPK